MGIVDRSLRNADVIAKGSVSATFLTQDQIRRIERDFPGFKARLEATESERGG